MSNPLSRRGILRGLLGLIGSTPVLGPLLSWPSLPALPEPLPEPRREPLATFTEFMRQTGGTYLTPERNLWGDFLKERER